MSPWPMVNSQKSVQLRGALAREDNLKALGDRLRHLDSSLCSLVITALFGRLARAGDCPIDEGLSTHCTGESSGRK